MTNDQKKLLEFYKEQYSLLDGDIYEVLNKVANLDYSEDVYQIFIALTKEELNEVIRAFTDWEQNTKPEEG